MPEETDVLKNELDKIASYPEIFFEKINCEISGVGFFPGARGLWDDNDKTISNKRVMVLGHDFGGKKDFDRSCRNGKENLSGATWKNLLEMLKEFGIEKEKCFFTNAVMGVRRDGISAIRKSPVYDCPHFLFDCQKFLLTQIRIQMPKLILVLGKNTWKFLGGISPELKVLSEIKSFKKIDESGWSSFSKISFSEIESYTTQLAIVTHPSYRKLNVKHRNYQNENGIRAEMKMISQLGVV